MKLKHITLMTLVALTSSVAMAETMGKPAAVSVEAGSLGYGANVAWGVNDSVELQAGWNGAKIDQTADFDSSDLKKLLDKDDVSYKGKVNFNAKTSTPYLGVQLRPFNNWLTVGTGILVPQQSLDVEAITDTTTDITIAGRKFEIAPGDSVKVNIENRNKLAPYLTVGLRPNINSRFGISAEVGAAYMGKYDSTVTVMPTAENAQKANAAEQAGQDNQYKNLSQEIANKLNDVDIPVYPIVKLGATIRF